MTSLAILAQGAQNASGGDGVAFNIFMILPYLLIFAVFWFFLIRPQQVRMKEHRARVAAVRPRDMVVTAGGVVGKVLRVEEEHVEVEIASGVSVRVVKATLSDIITKNAANNNNTDSKSRASKSKAKKSNKARSRSR